MTSVPPSSRLIERYWKKFCNQHSLVLLYEQKRNGTNKLLLKAVRLHQAVALYRSNGNLYGPMKIMFGPDVELTLDKKKPMSHVDQCEYRLYNVLVLTDCRSETIRKVVFLTTEAPSTMTTASHNNRQCTLEERNADILKQVVDMGHAIALPQYLNAINKAWQSQDIDFSQQIHGIVATRNEFPETKRNETHTESNLLFCNQIAALSALTMLVKSFR